MSLITCGFCGLPACHRCDFVVDAVAGLVCATPICHGHRRVIDRDVDHCLTEHAPTEPST